MTTPTPYDILIVGYGPAGITAAIYAARKRLTVALIGDLPGGEVRNSGDIENWPGDQHTDGNTLADKLIAHLGDHKDLVTIMQDKVLTITQESPTPLTPPRARGENCSLQQQRVAK